MYFENFINWMNAMGRGSRKKSSTCLGSDQWGPIVNASFICEYEEVFDTDLKQNLFLRFWLIFMNNHVTAQLQNKIHDVSTSGQHCISVSQFPPPDEVLNVQ